MLLTRDYRVTLLPAVVITDGDGRFLLGRGGRLPAEEMAAMIEGAPAYFAARKELEAARTPQAAAAAKKKMEALGAVAARAALVDQARNDQYPDRVRRAALDELAKQPGAAGDLVPFLTDENPALRRRADAGLKRIGRRALPALLNALESADPDQRVASYRAAAEITRVVQASVKFGDEPFWRKGTDENRAVTLADWRAWYDLNKPAGRK
jgi:hypothetical protein